MVTGLKWCFLRNVLIVGNSGEFVENSRNFSNSSSSTLKILDYLKYFFSLKVVFSSFLMFLVIRVPNSITTTLPYRTVILTL